MPIRKADARSNTLLALGRMPQNLGANNKGKNTTPLSASTAGENTQNLLDNPTI